MVGDVVAEHLLLVRHADGLRQLACPGRAGASRRASGRRSSPPGSSKSDTYPSLSLRRADAICSTVCSNTSSRPPRWWPIESNAPALIIDSTVRLFSAVTSTRQQKSKKSLNGPACCRAAMMCWTTPSPTLRMPARPNRTQSGRCGSGANPSCARFTSGGRTSTPILRADARYFVFSSFESLEDVSSAEMYSTGWCALRYAVW